MIDELVEHAKNLRDNHHAIRSAGVSIGGPLDADRGIIDSPPNLPGWDSIPLREILQDRLDLPVRVDHDAAACALAEQRWGAGEGAERLVYLTCGTGFGAGIIIDGLPYYGREGRSPEIGHVRYAEDGPVAFGKKGSFESYASGSSLRLLAAWKFPDRWGGTPPDPPEIGQLASDGDADALEVLFVNACAVGDACALVADLLVPQVIVLGSLSLYLGNSWFQQVQDRFHEQALPAHAEGCRLTPPGLGERLQDCSALAVAARQI
jgi:glucokinase